MDSKVTEFRFVQRGSIYNLNPFTTRVILFFCSLTAVFAAAEDVICSGTVINADGKPEGDVHVFLYETAYDTATSEITRHLIAQSVSDSQGSFSFNANRSVNANLRWATVLAAKKGMGLRWSPWNLQSPKTLALTLGEYGKLSGKVVHPDGSPAADVLVRALLMLPVQQGSTEISYFDWLTCRTDDTGRFAFNYIPTEAVAEFCIEATGQSYCTAEQGLLTESMKYRCDTLNRPIVLLNTLRIENSPDSVGYGELLVNSRYLEFLTARAKLNLSFESESLNEVAAVEKTWKISGTVIEEPFIPLPDVTILVYDVFQDERRPFGFRVELSGETVTDAAGRFAMERAEYPREADHSVLLAYKKDYSLMVSTLEAFQNEIEPVKMAFGHKEFKGRITDSSGKPVADAKICAYVSSFTKADTGFVTNPQESEAAETKLLTANSNSQGEFVISNIPMFAKGEFAIEAPGYAKHYTWTTDEPPTRMTYPAGGTPLEFTLQRECSLEGQLVDAISATGIAKEKIFIGKVDGSGSHRPVWTAVGGSQMLKDIEGNNRVVITNEQGAFFAEHLAPGTYEISLDCFVSSERKWYTAAQQITVAEGQTGRVKLAGMAPGIIRVLVQDTDNQPLAGANISLKSTAVRSLLPDGATEKHTASKLVGQSAGSDEQRILFIEANRSGDTLLPVRTSNEGVAEFRVTPGEYAIEKVQKTDYIYQPSENAIRVRSGGRAAITVVMQHQIGFSGHAIDPTGQPVKNTAVRQLSFQEEIAITDDEGRFSFIRESIRQIGVEDTRCLGTEAPWDVEPRMLPQDLILIGVQSDNKIAGWTKFNWERDFNLQLRPLMEAKGKITDPNGQSLSATVTVWAIRDKMSLQYLDMIFEQKDFYFFQEVQTSDDGCFRLQLIPDFSYLIEVTAEGHGKARERAVCCDYDDQMRALIAADKDYIVKTDELSESGRIIKKQQILWALYSGKQTLDFGTITLKPRNMGLSGIVVDRMGNPLEGYRVHYYGNGQVIDYSGVVTGKDGRFNIEGLCEGEVAIRVTNGKNGFIPERVAAGRTDLRIVIADIAKPQETATVHANESLVKFEIAPVNRDTREAIHEHDVSFLMKSENGDEFHVERDSDGRFCGRAEPGVYTVETFAYPSFSRKEDIRIELKAQSSNVITVELEKFPMIEGAVHLPDGVTIDQLEMEIQPDGTLSIDDDLEIAGDGQFHCRITWMIADYNKNNFPSHGWFWVHTKDWTYVSRTKFPLKDKEWVDVLLQPAATAKFEKTPAIRRVDSWLWKDGEYTNQSTGSTLHRVPTEIMVEEEGYFGIRGLIPGQDDLTYILLIGNVIKTVTVQSIDLTAGQETVIEIPENLKLGLKK